MNHFVTGVSAYLQKECHLATLHENMKISRLIVHDQQLEEARSKRKSKDTKKARSFDSGSSKGKTYI